MVVTIRARFRRRIRRILAALLLAWLLIPVGVIYFTRGRDQGHVSAVAAGLFALSACLVLGALAGLLTVRCPRCATPLAHLGSDLTHPFRRALAERCPRCGIGFDEPSP